MSRVSRGTPAGDAYLDLKSQAQRSGRPTQELLQLYVLEGFLARLAVANDVETVLELVRSVLGVAPSQDDGIEFVADTATADVIREEDDYSGVRAHVEARLASAQLPFHVDVNVGDPIWPEPTTVSVPRLRGGAPIELPGYPMHMVHAEKIVTAVQRGIANTRWRDFGDIWSLSRRRRIDMRDLRQAIEEVARYRNASLRPLAEVLDGFAVLAQSHWLQWRRRSNSDHLPEQFDTVLGVVIELADPALTEGLDGSAWDPEAGVWR